MEYPAASPGEGSKLQQFPSLTTRHTQCCRTSAPSLKVSLQLQRHIWNHLSFSDRYLKLTQADKQMLILCSLRDCPCQSLSPCCFLNRQVSLGLEWLSLHRVHSSGQHCMKWYYLAREVEIPCLWDGTVPDSSWRNGAHEVLRLGSPWLKTNGHSRTDEGPVHAVVVYNESVHLQKEHPMKKLPRNCFHQIEHL